MGFLAGNEKWRDRKRVVWLVALTALLFVGRNPTETLAQIVETEVVALTGDVIPAGTISNLGAPSVVSPDVVVFQANIDIGAFDDPSALLLYQGARLNTIVLEPHLLPGGQEELRDFFLNGISVPLLNSSADILFNAEIRPVDTCCPDEGLFLYNRDTAVIKTIVRDGTPTANGNGVLFVSQINQPALNDTEQAAFWASISGAVGGLGNGSGIFRADEGSLTRIVRTGQIPPDGASFFDALSWPTMNSIGEVAFVGFTDSNEEGVYRGNGGPLVEIARTDGTLPPGWIVRDLSPVSGVPVNDIGQVAFRAQVDTGAASCCLNAVYIGDGTTTTLLAFEGQALEGMSGSVPVGIGRNVTLNNAGQVAFTADGIFRVDSSNLLTIALEDGSVPGTASGTFEVIPRDEFTINDNGDTVFAARFQNGGVFQDGLFFYSDDTGLLPALVQEGSPLAGGIVDRFEFAGTNFDDIRAGEPTGLDEDGDVTFFFRLEDGTEGIALVEICEVQSVLDLFGINVTGLDIREACEEITVSNVVVAKGGDLTLQAGNAVIFESGFSVEEGGKLQVVIDTP